MQPFSLYPLATLSPSSWWCSACHQKYKGEQYRTCLQGTHPPEAEKGLERITMWLHSLSDGSKAQRRKSHKASRRSLGRRPGWKGWEGCSMHDEEHMWKYRSKGAKAGPKLGAGGTKIKRHIPSPLGAYSLVGKADQYKVRSVQWLLLGHTQGQHVHPLHFTWLDYH